MLYLFRVCVFHVGFCKQTRYWPKATEVWLPSVDGEEKITKSDESHYNNILTPAHVQMKLNAIEQQVFLKSSLWG